MPRKKDSKVIGRCKCLSCDSTMGVLQNVRGYLYTNCPECGCDQRNGAKHQTYLWSNTDWLDGEPEKAPINLISTGVEPEPRPEVEKVPVDEPDVPENTETKQGDKKKGGLGFLWVPAGVLAAILLGGR